MTQNVATCGPEDDSSTALATMKRARVRRLPVTGFGDTVIGSVSLDDIVIAAGPQTPISSDEVVEAMQAICRHHHAAPHIVLA